MVNLSENALFTDFLAKYIREKRKIDVKPYGIRFLFYFKNSRAPISIEGLCGISKSPEDVVKFAVKSLESNGLITRASPEWKITPIGQSVIKDCERAIPKFEKLIKEDAYLSEISKFTSTD
jgi:hypothetical protein